MRKKKEIVLLLPNIIKWNMMITDVDPWSAPLSNPLSSHISNTATLARLTLAPIVLYCIVFAARTEP